MSAAGPRVARGGLNRLGLPVGRRGDWFGYAFPNGLGWTLIALTDLAALYLLGSAASAAWTRARQRRYGNAE